MSKIKSDAHAHEAHAQDAMDEARDAVSEDLNGGSRETDDGVATAATVGVVAVGALIFEAGLLPGLVLGVAAALAPRYLPQLGSALEPVYRSTVRGVYKLGQRSREAIAEAQEHFHDIAAEVDAEDSAKARAKEAAAADARTTSAAA